jgi:DNA-3-methyladenine glycosylase II
VKLERLHGVAQAALDGLLDADHLISLGDKAQDAVRAIPGIGAFWSQAVYMRTCSVTDVWPEEPLSNAALGALHGLGNEPSAKDIARITDAYRPWRTWVAVLVRFGAGRGHIPNFAGREGRIRRGARSRT